jgi:heme A synthase
MAEKPVVPARKSPVKPFALPTGRNRRYVWLLVGGLIAFCVIVILSVAQRFPQVWPYIVVFELHYHLSRLALVIAGVMAALGFYLGVLRKRDVTPLFRYATYIVFGTMVLQALLGLWMYSQNGRPNDEVHLIYGFAAVLALPFFIFVEVTAQKRPAMGSYIWGFMLLLGVIIRSIMTGG